MSRKKAFFIPFVSLPMAACPSMIQPLDSPQMPARGFFMGVLPMPAEGEGFQDAYAKAARHAEFVPTWGRGEGSGFWGLTEDLAGERGNTFVKQLVRGNGIFPILHFSFMDKAAAAKGDP